MPTAADAPRPSRRLWLGVATFVLSVGAAGYVWLGNPAGWRAGPDAALSQHDVAAQIDALAARLKDYPNDGDGWTMLARSYSAFGRFGEAVPAYKRALELRPGEAQLYADYADALASVQGRQLAGEPEQLLAKALRLDPDNMKALTLAGRAAFDRGEAALAARHWERALRGAEQDSEFARQLQTAVDAARQAAAAGPPAAVGAAARPASAVGPATTPASTVGAASAPAASTGATVATASSAAVAGEVTLAAALRGSVSPDDTVFVFARATEGPRVPLAVLRKQVKDLPFAFSLDDSMAMSPAMKLSSAKQVIVGARISKSGNPLAQPGDLQGVSEAVPVGVRNVQVRIAEVVR